MNGSNLFGRIVKAAVVVALYAFFFIGAVVLIIGCADTEEPYVAPHIVSIDPLWQEFTEEEMTELVGRGPLSERVPPRFVHVENGMFDTITVTFSSPSEDLRLEMDWLAQDGHLLDGNVLTMNLFCEYNRNMQIEQVQLVYLSI